MGIPTEELLERCSCKELQEYFLLFAIQAEERGDLPPPEPEIEYDDEPDEDDLTEDDLDAAVQAEIERVKGLKG